LGSADPDRELLRAEALRLVHDTCAAEVVASLRAAGVRSVLLKGTSVIPWIYGVGSTRYSRDVDILVAPRDADLAASVLIAHGFETQDPDRHDRHATEWLRRSPVAAVDLHVALPGVGLSPGEAWTVLAGSVERVTVQPGVEAEVLDPPGRALHLALHAAQHPAFIQSLQDLQQALKTLPPSLWDDAATLAARIDALPAFGAGLRLTPLGLAVAERLGVPSWLPPRVALRLSAAPPASLALDHALATKGVHRKARFLLGRLFPSPAAMRARSRLARRGRGGLLIAYLGRVAWLLACLPAASRAVLEARRQAARAPE
jgi:hypothetical protein